MTTAGFYQSTLLASVLVSSAAVAEQGQPSPRQEDQAHGHHFYSERLHNGADLIDYVVCNKTDDESDFFWTGAAFGVSQFDPLPAHHCLEKKDYLRRTNSSPVDFDSGPSKVYVLDRSAQVPTVYWCEFKGFDRCDEGVLGSIVSWSSSLREFAEGASDRPFRPIISVDAVLEGGRYQIEIRRADNNGQLLIIAKSPSMDGIALEPARGVEAKSAMLGDFFFGTDNAIGADLTADMPVVAALSSAASDQGVRLYFENRTPSAIALAIVVASDDGLLYRMGVVAEL